MYDDNKINIDSFVDYEAEYKAYIQKPKKKGRELIGNCPFHNDSSPSFTVNLDKGTCKCFAGCIEGNLITFLSKMTGQDSKEVYKELLEKYGKATKDFSQKKDDKDDQVKPFTLEEYARQKQIPEEYLKNNFGLETITDKSKTTKGIKFVRMPYYKDKDDKDPIFRKRFANKEFRWSWGAGKRMCLYGLWQYENLKKTKRVILVEGESDTQALWYMGLSALGVPGASMVSVKLLSSLKDFESIYIHQEYDEAGKAFVDRVCKTLYQRGYQGKVYSFKCADYMRTIKDPSEMLIELGKDNAKSEIMKLMEEAAELNIEEISVDVPILIQDAPIHLRIPTAYTYGENGIYKIGKEGEILIVSHTPIVICKRLENILTSEEKIEIAFKRDGVWKKAIYPRSVIFNKNGVTALGDIGCTVNSENAKSVVRYLDALEGENLELIPKENSTNVMGWQEEGFEKFLPGFADDISLDVEASLKVWASAYKQKGTLEEWINMVAPYRENYKFRFILASAFTAPLLKIISQRIFVVYNWGDSKGGKSAALKAALSVWGDPERLMVNFNATQVAIERMAGFYNDLPLGMDERQLAGDNQNAIEKIVYMIASGTGRTRGSKTGGLQVTQTWRTVMLATGEEPISKENTQTGVSTRVVEIYGGPFENEKDASKMHQESLLHYGVAGQKFIERLLDEEIDYILKLYQKFSNAIDKYCEEKLDNAISGSHKASIAAVCTADMLAENYIFRREKDFKKTMSMARSILKEQKHSVKDVNENATEHIVDWILSHKTSFASQESKKNNVGVVEQYIREESTNVCFGLLTKDKAYIYPTILDNELAAAGFSVRKTRRYWADKGIITTVSENKKEIYTVRKFFKGRQVRLIEFDLKRFADATFTLKEDKPFEGFRDATEYEQQVLKDDMIKNDTRQLDN